MEEKILDQLSRIERYSLLADNITRLVPLYHSFGTLCDTSVVPLVAVVGTGTIRVL